MKKISKLVATAALSLIALTGAGCQGEKTAKKEVVKIIVPYGAGGTADAIARKYAKIASEQFKEYEFVAENKTGGDGFVASAYFQNVNPKSKELFVLGYGNAYRHTLGKQFGTEQVPYDLNKILPLYTIDDRTWIIYAKPGVSVSDVLQKAKTGNLKMSGGNPLSDPHLALGSLLALEGGKVTVVGYDGGAAQKQGLTSGEVDVFVGTTQAGMSDVEVGTIVPILAISENGYHGFKGPNGKIEVPGLVKEKSKDLDLNKDYSSSILPAGGFIAARSGADPKWTDKVIEVSKSVWATEEYSKWIEEIGLNKLEIYGADAQKALDEANQKAVNAYKLLSGK